MVRFTLLILARRSPVAPFTMKVLRYITTIFSPSFSLFPLAFCSRTLQKKNANMYKSINQTLTQTPPPEQTPKTQFPDKLKDYVARTFEDCPPDEKVAVELELKRIITDAFNEKVVWSLEWDKMPLPQTILARKKVTAKEEQTAKALAMGQMSRVSNESGASPTPPFIRKPNYSNVMDADYPGKKRKR